METIIIITALISIAVLGLISVIHVLLSMVSRTSENEKLLKNINDIYKGDNDQYDGKTRSGGLGETGPRN